MFKYIVKARKNNRTGTEMIETVTITSARIILESEYTMFLTSCPTMSYAFIIPFRFLALVRFNSDSG